MLGSTAISTRRENDLCASQGDFDAASGTLHFAPGAATASFQVPVHHDGIWEQGLFQYEAS